MTMTNYSSRTLRASFALVGATAGRGLGSFFLPPVAQWVAEAALPYVVATGFNMGLPTSAPFVGPLVVNFLARWYGYGALSAAIPYAPFVGGAVGSFFGNSLYSAVESTAGAVQHAIDCRGNRAALNEVGRKNPFLNAYYSSDDPDYLFVGDLTEAPTTGASIGVGIEPTPSLRS